MFDTVKKRLVLIDFGISCSSEKILSISEDITKIRGTPDFISPERLIIDNELQIKMTNRKINEKSDIWAAGITIYHIMEKTIPWNSKSYETLAKQITGLHDITFTYKSSSLINTIKLALIKDPVKRYSADQILSFLKETLYNKMRLNKVTTIREDLFNSNNIYTSDPVEKEPTKSRNTF
jgi:serine/threonine protein kinase